MVGDGWHDGYEEQEEEFIEYMCDLKAPFQAVYDVGIVQGTAYEACHEVLKCIADTWENMKTIPGRSCCEDMASNFETSHIEITLSKWAKGKMRSFMGAPTGALGYMWRLLLQSAAGNSKTTDEELFRYIKDATDFDIDILVSEDPDDDDEELVITEVDAHHKAGLERLTRLHSQEDKWNSLPTTKKVHRQRRCIDRRLDGPKHRRTRDYDSDSDGYGYGNTDAFMNIFAYALASGAFGRR